MHPLDVPLTEKQAVGANVRRLAKMLVSTVRLQQPKYNLQLEQMQQHLANNVLPEFRDMARGVLQTNLDKTYPAFAKFNGLSPKEIFNAVRTNSRRMSGIVGKINEPIKASLPKLDASLTDRLDLTPKPNKSMLEHVIQKARATSGTVSGMPSQRLATLLARPEVEARLATLISKADNVIDRRALSGRHGVDKSRYLTNLGQEIARESEYVSAIPDDPAAFGNMLGKKLPGSFWQRLIGKPADVSASVNRLPRFIYKGMDKPRLNFGYNDAENSQWLSGLPEVASRYGGGKYLWRVPTSVAAKRWSDSTLPDVKWNQVFTPHVGDDYANLAPTDVYKKYHGQTEFGFRNRNLPNSPDYHPLYETVAKIPSPDEPIRVGRLMKKVPSGRFYQDVSRRGFDPTDPT